MAAVVKQEVDSSEETTEVEEESTDPEEESSDTEDEEMLVEVIRTTTILGVTLAKSKQGPAGSIRVGEGFQAVIPDLIPEEDRVLEEPSGKGVCIWTPQDESLDKKIAKFVAKATNKYNYTPQQAMGVLYWNKCDFKAANKDLPSFVPYEEEWTDEEVLLFNVSYNIHRTNFTEYKRALPRKSMKSLVSYYYSKKKEQLMWKKAILSKK